jgi:hypothetical protein
MIRKYILKIKVVWLNIFSVFRRERTQTAKAIKILRKVIRKEDPTPEEIRFLKGQSLDLVKIVGLMGLGAVSVAIPIALEKSLNKWDISIMPKDQELEIKKDNDVKKLRKGE